MIIESSRRPFHLCFKRVGEHSLPLPAYQTEGAGAVDLQARLDVSLHQHDRLKVPTGFAVQIPDGYEGTIRPRSSGNASGLYSTFGTIDADYRGELVVVLVNETGDNRTVRVGDRIAQLVVSPIVRPTIVEVGELGPTARGEGGFGSTDREVSASAYFADFGMALHLRCPLGHVFLRPGSACPHCRAVNLDPRGPAERELERIWRQLLELPAEQTGLAP